MKKIIVLLTMLVVVLGFAISSNAVLNNNGDGTITDTDTNLLWLQDANYASTSGYDTDGLMNRSEAQTWIGTLNSSSYMGYDNWRLPSTETPCRGWDCTDSEMGNMFYNILGNESRVSRSNSGPFSIPGSVYWSETMDTETKSWYFTFDVGWQESASAGSGMAWAVRVVPEPVSSTLFLIGGAAFAGRRFLRRAKVQ